MDVKIKVKEIVLQSLKSLGEEEMISEFINASDTTKIEEVIDSMALVVLSVDIEEGYEAIFGKEIKILNEEEGDFLLKFKDVSSLVKYIYEM